MQVAVSWTFLSPCVPDTQEPPVPPGSPQHSCSSQATQLNTGPYPVVFLIRAIQHTAWVFGDQATRNVTLPKPNTNCPGCISPLHILKAHTCKHSYVFSYLGRGSLIHLACT